jgi:hypothetical protein
MAKFENVGRRDGPRTGGKARKDVSIIYDYQGESILTDNFKRLACEDAARESSSGISC